jgi:hypothetical protein
LEALHEDLAAGRSIDPGALAQLFRGRREIIVAGGPLKIVR